MRPVRWFVRLGESYIGYRYIIGLRLFLKLIRLYQCSAKRAIYEVDFDINFAENKHMPADRPTDADLITATIKQRKTFKVLASSSPEEALAQSLADDQRLAADSRVATAIRDAGWAPFHYDRAADGMAEPWRVEFLTQSKCREVADNFFQWFDDVKPSNKLPSMLNACGSLVLVSWLPQFAGQEPEVGSLTEKQQQVDEEHLAATAAYVQNLILILTAHGFGTYWSSGGQFRSAVMRRKLGIDHDGRLLAAVFVDYQVDCESVERLPGKLRERRSVGQQWFKSID